MELVLLASFFLSNATARQMFERLAATHYKSISSFHVAPRYQMQTLRLLPNRTRYEAKLPS